MQQENALIGVAEAAFFPDISLSGVLQWIGKNPLPFSVANEVWSLGAAASEPILDGGLHAAELDAARATYWQSVANYRQTVLTAFQGVEDELAAIRILSQQLAVQEAAVKNARTAVDVYLNQFQAGTIAFTTVVTGGGDLAGRRGGRVDHPAEPVPRQRHPDRGPRAAPGTRRCCPRRRSWSIVLNIAATADTMNAGRTRQPGTARRLCRKPLIFLANF